MEKMVMKYENIDKNEKNEETINKVEKKSKIR